MGKYSVDWKGYIPAITTNFNRAGEFDSEGMRALVRWLLGQGVHGVVTAGTQGEWFAMSFEEKASLFSVVSEELKGKCTIIAGCNGFTVDEVVKNAELAESLGFDGILLSAPAYMSLTEREVYQFFSDVSDRVYLPICVYNWPPGTNLDMSFELISKLAELEKVVALKHSTPDLHSFVQVFYAMKDKIRVFGVPVNEFGISLMKEENAAGQMGAAAILGSEHPQFFNAIWDGDYETAKRIGSRDSFLMQSWFTPDLTGRFASAQAIFKEALNLQGLPGGYPRQPILPLDDSGKEIVRRTLEILGKI
ncbi:dihydrodipicolinate synthase family protein [Aestuariicella hydrocarbonica]|uniref:Dihydrodipicolinate synthase family protein n=1 Tax=Pseudomaricurvus hydrocarbonicus TaxID=1470433 RepID=A0A9E5T548_9GAMM|nr:dihydrodipicolinate synthase family protein [Aestuariicella hydrocarbonica]